MKKLVILTFAFFFAMTGCSQAYNNKIKEPDVNDIVETNRVTKLEKLKTLQQQLEMLICLVLLMNHYILTFTS